MLNIYACLKSMKLPGESENKWSAINIQVSDIDRWLEIAETLEEKCALLEMKCEMLENGKKYCIIEDK